MKEIRLATKIIKTLTKDNLHYPSRLIADLLVMIGRCGILLALYWYVFKVSGGSINGVTYPVVAWSMFLYFIISNFSLRNIARLIMKDVQSGSVETILNKPVSYILYKIWWKIGMHFYNFITIGILGTITISLIIGIPDIMQNTLFLFTLFLTIILGMILTLILYGIVGVIAFWVEDINPIFWIIDKFVMILGGSYLPIALFPNFMYQVAIWSPFGASMFVTHTVNNSWLTNWPLMIGIQLFWILTLGLILYWMFDNAKKKISVNGG